MERTPACTLNLSVSCESTAVPEYQPFTDRRPEINTSGETCSDSAAPMTTSVPLRPKPPCTALIASPFVTVASITFERRRDERGAGRFGPQRDAGGHRR